MTRKEYDAAYMACHYGTPEAQQVARLEFQLHADMQWEKERHMPLHKLCAKILREAPRPPGCTRTLPAWLVDGLHRTTTA